MTIHNYTNESWSAQARRWARAWKKTAKDERAANDMLVPGWRWQSVRIMELEKALGEVLRGLPRVPTNERARALLEK